MSPTLSLAHCAMLALLPLLLTTCVTARSAAQTSSDHADEKRFYIPVVVSSDAILASLKNRHVIASSEMMRQNGLERKRTAAARLEYLDSLLPRSIEPKRKMFWSPLGYMSASARRLNQNNPAAQPPSSREDTGSPGFRYG